MKEFCAKNALITGATGGIGKEIAKVLYSAGFQLFLTGTNQEKLIALQNEFPTAYVTSCDLSDPQQIESMLQSVKLKYNNIDILINNAGLTADNLCLRMKNEEWDKVLNTNLRAAFILSKECLRDMIKKRYGKIINITSVVAVTGNPGQANYCAAKAGMIGMTKSMALEVASRNININCIAPGFIQSDMTNALTEQQKAAILSKIPQQQMGSVEDIAYAVEFLISDKARYITGQTLHVNGGLAMI